MTFKEKLAWEFNYMAKLSKNPARLAQYLVSKIHTQISSFSKLAPFYKNKKGIEIGGPSKIFTAKGYIPVYTLAQQVDGCNFSNNTVWENTIKEGLTYNTGSTIGHQYILDGINLSPIASASYDFVLSSHSLEHIANPLKALKEWLRVLKPGGVITLILPDSRYTFDCNRPITKFEHLLDDYNNDTTEDDLTHLDEIVLLHDYTKDNGVSGIEQFKQRALKNMENRCLHQHVFDLNLLKQIFNYLNLQVVVTDASFPHHLTIVGLK